MVSAKISPMFSFFSPWRDIVIFAHFRRRFYPARLAPGMSTGFLQAFAGLSCIPGAGDAPDRSNRGLSRELWAGLTPFQFPNSWSLCGCSVFFVRVIVCFSTQRNPTRFLLKPGAYRGFFSFRACSLVGPPVDTLRRRGDFRGYSIALFADFRYFFFIFSPRDWRLRGTMKLQ